jgi:hypothetical protein
MSVGIWFKSTLGHNIPQLRAARGAPGTARDAALMFPVRSLCFPPLDQCGEPLGGLPLGARQDVGVHRLRDHARGVAQPLGDHMHGLAGGCRSVLVRCRGGVVAAHRAPRACSAEVTAATASTDPTSALAGCQRQVGRGRSQCWLSSRAHRGSGLRIARGSPQRAGRRPRPRSPLQKSRRFSRWIARAWSR